MSDLSNLEKLASVLNTTSQQGKAKFVKMLWGNQPVDIQTQLMPLLAPDVHHILDGAPE